MSIFKKAEKSKSFLRLAISGPTGSGKTYSALSIATGLSQSMDNTPIVFVDTEHGSGSLYADDFNFNVLEFNKPYTISKYIRAINAAQEEGFKILIIDSLTHAWQELLEEHEILSKTKYKNNSFWAWSETTPKQNKFIEALLSFKGHIICTIRSKMEYALEQEAGQKAKIVKLGMGLEQRKGLEYEFAMLLEGTVENFFTFTKARSKLFHNRTIEKPSEKLGKELYTWLNAGK
jgi:hypothetical protein